MTTGAAPSRSPCVAERFAVQASIDMRGHGQYVGSSTDPYVVDGEERVFGPGEGAAQGDFLADVVLVPMVASVLARAAA